jgi:heme-degrading monooxygenase HmoA
MVPEPPYFAVVFTSARKPDNEQAYAAMAARMEELARSQPGFLGIDTARSANGMASSCHAGPVERR